MQAHKAAAVFPLLSDEEIGALANDIAAHGQRDPIVLLDGEILDGRNRFAACERAGITPVFRDATDEERADPIAFVVSKNLHRRHMEDMWWRVCVEVHHESARAMAAARLRDLSRQNSDSAPLGVRASAALLNVSHQAVAEAARVIDRATPELVAAVDRGDVAVSAAATLTKLPVEEQRAAASDEEE